MDTKPLFGDDDDYDHHIHDLPQRGGRRANVRQFVDDPDASNSEDELYNVRVWRDEKDPIT